MSYSLSLSSQNQGQLQKEKEFNQAVEQYRNRLLGFVKSRINNLDDAEDLVQDVFLQLLNSYDLVEPVRNIGSWLYAVARNKIIDRYRKKRPLSFSQLKNESDDETEAYFIDTLVNTGDRTSPLNALFEKEFFEHLSKAIGKLASKQREVFVAHELDGKSFKEISAESGVNINTLLSRKRYAILELRKALAEHYQEFSNN